MADPTAGASSSLPSAPRCPWCSAELPKAKVKVCPSCKANLAGDGDAEQLPGLTAIDLEKLAFRRSTSPKRSRLMSWISGDLDYEDASEPVAPPGSLEPPPPEVRREMLRLEMDALIADLSAEAAALDADQAVAQGANPAVAASPASAVADGTSPAPDIGPSASVADVPAAEGSGSEASDGSEPEAASS